MQAVYLIDLRGIDIHHPGHIWNTNTVPQSREDETFREDVNEKENVISEIGNLFLERNQRS